MLYGNAGQQAFLSLGAIPPIQFLDVWNLSRLKPLLQVQGNKEHGAMGCAPSDAQSEYPNDRNDRAKSARPEYGAATRRHARRNKPFWSRKANRARPFRPVRVREDIEAIELNKQGGMADPCDRRAGMICSQPRAIIVRRYQRTGSRVQRCAPESGHNKFHSLPLSGLGKDRIDVPKSACEPVTIRSSYWFHLLF